MTDRAPWTPTPPALASRTSRSGASSASSLHERQLTRTPRGDLAALPAAMHSELIKVRSLRSNTAIAVLTGLLGLSLTWATAALVGGEVIVSEDALVLSDVFISSTFLTAVIAAIASMLTITSESQYGTLATALSGQPARWVIVAAKTGVAIGIGVALGAIGMIVRHSAAAISGFIIWWLVIENLLAAFLPEAVSRFMPFYAGAAVLGVEVYKTTAETVAVALSRAENVLVFGGYAAVAVIAGTVLLYRRDTS